MYDADFLKGWDDGCEDARRVIPLRTPRAMRTMGLKPDGPWSGAVYVQSASYRDGFALGYSAVKGAERVGPA